MFSRIRSLLASIAFAGMKPGVKPSQGAKRLHTRLPSLLERIASGGAGNDPLYLTNRSLGQRIKVWLVIGVPLTLVIAGLGAAMMGLVQGPPSQPPAEISPQQVSEKLLPGLDKHLDVLTDHTIEVTDAHIEHKGSAKLVGTVRNTTAAAIPGADMVFDLTNLVGSRVGAVGTHLSNVPANGAIQFEIPISQEDAAFALVREVTRQ